jgi:ribosome-binding protein aMBF1 (putative translation factor)
MPEHQIDMLRGVIRRHSAALNLSEHELAKQIGVDVADVEAAVRGHATKEEIIEIISKIYAAKRVNLSN